MPLSSEPSRALKCVAEARVEDLHYKLRLLDLVETFAKAVSTSALLPMLILPLLYVARRADHEQASLRAKAVRILRDHVCTSKPAIDPVADAAQAVELPDVLRLVHSIARSTSSPEVADACSRSSLWLAKLLEPSVVGEVYVATIVDYVTRRASGVQPGLVSDFVKQRPSVAWEVRDQIAAAVFGKTVNTHRAVQALAWLQALLKSYLGSVRVLAAAGRITPDDEQDADACKASLLTWMPSVRAKVLAKLDGSTAVPVAYVKELLKFAMACIRLTQRCTQIAGALKAAWLTEDVEAAVVALGVGPGTKDARAVQGLAKQLRAMVEWEKPDKKGKRKREDADGKKKRVRR